MISKYYPMSTNQHHDCCPDSIQAAQRDHVKCLKYHDRNNSSGSTMKEIRDAAVGAGALDCVKWSYFRCNSPHISTYEKSNEKCKKWLDQHGYNHTDREKELSSDLSSLQL